MTALRLLSPADLIARGGASFEPVIDHWVAPESPAETFASGRQANVPLIVGTNADEGSVFTKDVPLKTTEDYRAYLASQYPAAAEWLFAQYPASDESQARSAASRIFTDRMIVSARSLASLQAKVNPKTFVYHFTHMTGPLGAFHTSEVPFVFGSDPGTLAKSMSGAWVKFAAAGDPRWPAYAGAGGQYIEFGDAIRVVSEQLMR